MYDLCDARRGISRRSCLLNFSFLKNVVSCVPVDYFHQKSNKNSQCIPYPSSDVACLLSLQFARFASYVITSVLWRIFTFPIQLGLSDCKSLRGLKSGTMSQCHTHGKRSRDDHGLEDGTEKTGTRIGLPLSGTMTSSESRGASGYRWRAVVRRGRVRERPLSMSIMSFGHFGVFGNQNPISPIKYYLSIYQQMCKSVFSLTVVKESLGFRVIVLVNFPLFAKQHNTLNKPIIYNLMQKKYDRSEFNYNGLRVIIVKLTACYLLSIHA